MTKRNFLFAFLINALLSHAQQKNVTLYAYKQRSTGGAQKMATVNESGTLIKQTPPQFFQYVIYMAATSKYKLHPVMLWIEGKPFSVKTEEVTNTPVKRQNSIPQENEIVLVPKTTGMILKLIPVASSAAKGSKKASTLARQNAVLVLYKCNGKWQYGVLKKFTELDAPLLQ